MNFFQKLRETISSVLPIMIIVLVLGMTVVPLETGIMVRFIIGGVVLIFGLTVFLAGVDLGILPVGERCGAALTAKRNLALLLGISFLIGVMVTIAEPTPAQERANVVRPSRSEPPVVNAGIIDQYGISIMV